MNEGKTGVVYVKVKLQLELDLDQEDVQDLVDNMDCNFNFNDPRIAEAEIVDHQAGYA